LQVGENVVLPLWIAASMTSTGNQSIRALDSSSNITACPNSTANHTQPTTLDNYFVMTFASFSFVIVFGLTTLGLKLFGRPETIGRTEKTFPQMDLFWIGFCDAINGIMVVFAATASRTSPLLQTLLGNFMIPLTIVARLVILRKRPSLIQGLSAAAVFLALFLCLVPNILDLDKSKCAESNTASSVSGPGRILWPLCFMFGFLPAAIMNVLEERSLKRRDPKAPGSGQINLFYFLFWTSLYQLLTAATLFWTDIIPGFGTAEGSLRQFGENYWFGVKCFFGGGGCGSSSGLRGTLFIAFYVVSYIGGGLLLRHSDGATFLAIVNSLVTPLGFLFWTLFQDPSEGPFKWDPHASYSTYFSLGGLILMIPFVFLYNYQRAQKRTKSDEETPLTNDSAYHASSGYPINPDQTYVRYEGD
jgi:hypothetical protein